VQLAKAGFFFNPAAENPDNVTCFLCHKGLDGWEDDDDPLLEHIKHSSHCGWAIVSAVEAGIEGYELEDSTQPLMVEARKATFAGRWPHEGKRGWKCKTKQVRFHPCFHRCYELAGSDRLCSLPTRDGTTHRVLNQTIWLPVPIASLHLTAGNQATSHSRSQSQLLLGTCC
jgi:hypothetical protein